MSDYVTDEMVEAAARAHHEAAPGAGAGSWDASTPRVQQRALIRARAALTATAPLIAATALRDAADGVDLSPSYPTPGLSELHNAEGAAEAYLRARADRIEEAMCDE